MTWLLADQQGSVRDVIDDSGAVVDHIVYDSYGNILSQTSSENQPRFAYAGMQLDAAMGLYYDHARYYDAGTGTFISQDPIGFAGGTADLYDYVRNDPVNFVDPFGFSPTTRPGGTAVPTAQSSGGIPTSTTPPNSSVNCVPSTTPPDFVPPTATSTTPPGTTPPTAMSSDQPDPNYVTEPELYQMPAPPQPQPTTQPSASSTFRL